MAYAFNDDKSKYPINNICTKDDFIVIEDTGTITIPANTAREYNVFLENDFNLTSDNYEIIGIPQFSTGNSGNAIVSSWQETTVNNKWCLVFIINNISSNSSISLNIDTKIALIKK